MPRLGGKKKEHSVGKSCDNSGVHQKRDRMMIRSTNLTAATQTAVDPQPVSPKGSLVSQIGQPGDAASLYPQTLAQKDVFANVKAALNATQRQGVIGPPYRLAGTPVYLGGGLADALKGLSHGVHTELEIPDPGSNPNEGGGGVGSSGAGDVGWKSGDDRANEWVPGGPGPGAGDPPGGPSPPSGPDGGPPPPPPPPPHTPPPHTPPKPKPVLINAADALRVIGPAGSARLAILS